MTTATGPDLGAPRIALFGGSFDPPHLGHVLAACYARVVGGVDEVWVLPVAKHAYGKAISSWEQRWRLCQAAFAALPFVRLCDDERSNASGYTFDLIERLRQRHPLNQWLLVGGTDTAHDLLNWHRGAELIRLIGIIPVPRRGYDEHPAALPQISSSLIRERLGRGEDIAALVPPAVADLIAGQNWYR
ncbi:MAG: nicotinate-nicotinamide nucleotide adenylyltransferase [Planctomycetes bacterium]|jgi:nicotinate-nucleotide adenylyltransferase|nr:nicotinate-nicotinamide nucleotide adenylyltransferase [Planctomycetota bacterium]